MKLVTNSLTELLNGRLGSLEEVEMFIDNLEDDILGMPSRDFYNKYKGDIKELLEFTEDKNLDINYHSEILAALNVYYYQRSS